MFQIDSLMLKLSQKYRFLFLNANLEGGPGKCRQM